MGLFEPMVVVWHFHLFAVTSKVSALKVLVVVVVVRGNTGAVMQTLPAR
jgi:hypothetical protein